MLSGTVQSECRGRRSVSLLTPNTAVNGPDVVTRTSATMSTSADDTPHPQTTKYVTPATIHTTVNGVARGGRRATSIVVI